MTPRPEALLAVAVAAARAAGEVLRAGLGRPKAVEHKTARTSIVTWVDRAAQDEVVRVIAERVPDHAILAEEGPHDVTSGPLTWLVDPLDGTSNYAHGIPFACTSVAVADADGAIAGAVPETFRGELFTATRGGGAWLGDRRLTVSTTSALDEALVCTGVQSDDPAAIADFGRRIVALCTHADAERVRSGLERDFYAGRDFSAHTREPILIAEPSDGASVLR